MEIVVRKTQDFAVIVVAGEAHLPGNAEAFLSRMQELAAHRVCAVVVDLCRVRLAGAAFLGALAAGAEAVRRSGGKVVLTGVGPQLNRALFVTGLQAVLTVDRVDAPRMESRATVGTVAKGCRLRHYSAQEAAT